MDDIKNNRSDRALVIFLVISFSLFLFIGQNEVVARGSLTYWLILLPALFLPLTKLQFITYNIFSKTWPLLLMLIVILFWGLYKDDIRSIFRWSLFLLILSWLEVNSLTIKVKTMSFIYVASVIMSIFVYVFSDINHWGLIPGATDIEWGIWRVSFFPNIANTGFFSLFIFMLCTKDKETFAENKFTVLLSLYFVIFSFVRCAVISLAVYLILKFVFKKIKNIQALFVYSILAALILNIVVGYAGEIIASIQSIPLVNRLFLRGEHALTHHEIYVQMYRPWVWKNQWSIFINSPYWMGEGLYNFNDFITSSLRGEGFEETDSVSLLLGILASYGLPALLFFYYILNKNYQNARNLDTWACSIFPIFIFICMQWGSIFHPACATFIIFFLILLRGKRAFV